MRKGFTLIELLIVIGIVAILATVVVLTLNPAETLRQSRDSTRLAEVASLDKAIGFSVTQNPDLVLGAANTVYISLPDETGPTSNCPNYAAFLPTLAPGWQYRCVNRANLQKIDGTGWLPINFTGLPVVPLDSLPVDRVNTAQSGFYYSYATAGTGWEVDADMESTKYRWGGSADAESPDGGNTIVLFEKGSNLNALPKEANARITYSVSVPTSCHDAPPMAAGNGQEWYNRWQIPGSGNVAVTKISLWWADSSLGTSESVLAGIYPSSTGGKLISGSLRIYGAGGSGWVSSTLDNPVPVALGQVYIVGVAQSQEDIDNVQSYSLPNDIGGNCANYPSGPSPLGYFSGADGLLNPSVPGSSYNGSRLIIPGITYSL